MFEPVRGGTRGGQAEFKWSDVSADKDRENYLGHSINAPTGRWQKNKDIHWYNRDANGSQEDRDEEIRKIKEAEAEALAAALGFVTGGKPGGSVAASGPGTGSNAIGVTPKPGDSASLSRDADKEERRRRKEERRREKEEKRARKEKRRAERVHGRDDDDDDDREYSRHRHRSRSRSPRRKTSRDRYEHDQRTRSPSRSLPRKGSVDYDERAREVERERDRRRWEDNARRDRPGARWGRD